MRCAKEYGTTSIHRSADWTTVLLNNGIDGDGIMCVGGMSVGSVKCVSSLASYAV